MDCFLSLDEYYWQQRAQNDWLSAGDRNSKFFHRKASLRALKNEMRGLEDARGVWRSEEDEIASIIVDYFGNIFTSSGPTEEALS